MSNQLNKTENEIIEICLECLTFKKKIIQKKKGEFNCYVGGGRQYFPNDDQYTRTIYLGRGSKRYENVPEEVIDLNEVYHHYRIKNHPDWDEHIFHPTFSKSLDELKERKYLFMLDKRDIMSNSFDSASDSENKRDNSSFPPDKTPRFVKLNLK